MVPSTAVGLLIVLVFVLPGSVFTWAVERQTSAYGVTFADRVFRFIAVSVIFHLVLAWPEYALYRAAVAGRDEVLTGQFALLWVGLVLLVALPALIGTLLGGLYATRTERNGWGPLRRWLTPAGEARLLTVALGRTPAPRAWDNFFSERPTKYLRVRLADDTWASGRFADASYAGGFPHEADLYLEEAWDVDDDGTLGTTGLGYALYLPADTIKWFEVVPEDDP